MILAIWTKSPPKVQAIEEASKKCLYFKWKTIKVISEKVESWVSDMPLSLEENIEWAKNRAKNTKKLLDSQNKTADFYIWMEWWTTLIWNNAFLLGVVYIISNSWEEHFWTSNMQEVPKNVQKRLYKNWEDLWPIMDEILKVTNTKMWQWAVGYWSDWMLTREQEFYTAFISAIWPFYNKYYKI